MGFVNCQDQKEWDCFALASSVDQLVIIEFLLDNCNSQGADSMHLLTRDCDGGTPASWKKWVTNQARMTNFH